MVLKMFIGEMINVIYLLKSIELNIWYNNFVLEEVTFYSKDTEKYFHG